ncbi:unnamed protein product [Pleuronectes platessa]|uniref:Uncharacterized protein n=1 Tax=Pleuronectes platessa TaxID=8262 RepID=A0A9N7UYW7_PLEPL|nr:unnamed protein product [Pleuronectes platessa]
MLFYPDTAGGPPPRERRVPLTGAVAEVIREKSPTHVQSRCRRPSYPVPSNRSPPSAAPTDTAPRHTIRKAPAPRTSTSPPKKTSRSAAHRASGGVVRRATGRLLPQPQDVPSGLTTNTEIVTQGDKKGDYLSAPSNVSHSPGVQWPSSNSRPQRSISRPDSCSDYSSDPRPEDDPVYQPSA